MRPFVLALLLSIGWGFAAHAGPDEDDCSRNKDYVRMVAACSAVITRNPKAGWAFISRSYAYERLGRGEEAVNDGNRGVALSPQDPQAYVNRAAGYIALSNYDRAMADLSQALRLDPQFIDAVVNRAFVYEKQGLTDLAIADYRRGAELKPGSHHNTYSKEALKRLGADSQGRQKPGED